jgi:glycosyltransferase involved in cell wall biosynthesis
MRIALVTNYYPPEVGSNSYLYQSLGHYLAGRGHSVFVVTAQPRYNLPDGVAPPPAVYEEVPGVEVRRAKVPHVASSSLAVRALNESWLPFGLLSQLRHCLPLDAICMYSPPLSLGLVGIAARTLWGVPFVFNVQDLIPQAAIDMGALRNPLLIGALRLVERAIYSAAATVIVHSEGNRDAIRRYHSTLATRIAAIHNWVDLAQFEDLTPLPPEVEAFTEGRAVFSYGGALGRQHDISTILDAAATLRGRTDIAFVIAGGGAREEQWRERICRENLHQVMLVRAMPQKQFNSLLVRSRGSFLALSAMLKTPVVPGKLQAIMAAGIPALCVVNASSDATRIVAEAGCGFSVSPGESEPLVRQIVRLTEDPKLAQRLGEAGRAFACAHFSKESCMALFEGELCAAAGARDVLPVLARP